ncbi:MAG: alkaline phosphatase D family protein [Paracoccus sp. (in: a-proteobacteria)]|jgi:alkaline phosphatase D|uniref:alkaline phosphatase D family protein n=2 Tax=Paracoccus TaxID=265 RepID=UPI000C5A1684|nr:alkaline phosphatase D family protein [uncultured Paracoccus sp.]MAN57956.1 alkaline phosphatase [Paracoccus sp. (in: a-proteobacteria)]MBA47485.1 alkaline phosphatase [Paracoccus sp. (in: a-proteobacteria)]MDB2551660.1 alkaline phosphatase D family protein [Paracoccus sp. (in: a-proteobacteria)]|tara:strand:- start:1931 stop:3487 length:1557 start_codon:yes stop_codon:yes gene_type:complete
MTFSRMSRRRLLVSGLAGTSILAMPAISRASSRPVLTHGVQSGDVTAQGGMVWTRADRPSRIALEVATTESFQDARRLGDLNALPESDQAVKALVEGMAPDQTVFYRMTPTDLGDPNATGAPLTGRFRTAPTQKRDIRFVWSGDTAGQGWGIDDEGMRSYATMALHEPDFFIHSGDTIYADGPMQDEVAIEGGLWRNRILTDEVRKVAESLDEYRGRWKYNLMDQHVRALSAICPTLFQWDDHEVVNNWSPGKDLSADDRYSEKSVPLLMARAQRAFHEMTPISYNPAEPGRVYRKIGYGPLLDIFFLDLRSYRGANSDGMQDAVTAQSQILGKAQMDWLKGALKGSKATWKVIACDMPIGVNVWDKVAEDQRYVEAVANGDPGAAKGRELEFAQLLRFIRDEKVANTVWLTADVHYTAAHEYHPDRAAFRDFEPFWEFVSGPLHAGTFGPNDLDMTFGPEVKFVKAPPAGQANLPPSAGMQFFGIVDIEAASGQMRVRLMDRGDRELWSITLDPKPA